MWHSEPSNGAPVVMRMRVEEPVQHTETVYWDRRAYNGWIDLNGGGVNTGTEITVQVSNANLVEVVHDA